MIMGTFQTGKGGKITDEKWYVWVSIAKGWTHDGYCCQSDRSCNNQVDKVLGRSVTQSYYLIVTVSVSEDEKGIEEEVIV